MRQQLANITRPLRRQPRQHILQIGVQVMPIHPSRLDQTHDRRRPLATAQRPGKQSVSSVQVPTVGSGSRPSCYRWALRRHQRSESTLPCDSGCSSAPWQSLTLQAPSRAEPASRYAVFRGSPLLSPIVCVHHLAQALLTGQESVNKRRLTNWLTRYRPT